MHLICDHVMCGIKSYPTCSESMKKEKLVGAVRKIGNATDKYRPNRYGGL